MPLITDVTRNDTPEVVPTSPLALSRLPSSIRAVTMVGRAIVRMLPTMTPNMSSTISAHSGTLAGSVNSSRGAVWYTPNAAAYSRNDATADTCIIVVFEWWSTRLPNQMPVTAVSTRKMPDTTPVANTDLVSRYT